MQAFKSDKNIKVRILVGFVLVITCVLVGWLLYDKDIMNTGGGNSEDDLPPSVEDKPVGYGTFSPDFYDGEGKEELEAQTATKLKEIGIVATGYSERGSNGTITYIDNKKEKRTSLSSYTVVFDEAKLKVVFPDNIRKGDKLSVYLNEDNSAKLVVKGNKFSYLEMTDVLSLDGSNYVIVEKGKQAIKIGSTIPSAYVDRYIDVSEVKYGDGLVYALGGVEEDLPSELAGYTVNKLAKARLIN